MTTIERASALFGVPVSVLRGPSRVPSVCRARFAVMYVMRAHHLSLTSIGNALRRHHTTVLSGLRRADDLACRDPEFLALVEAIAL